jgi:hypothetical protein
VAVVRLACPPRPKPPGGPPCSRKRRSLVRAPGRRFERGLSSPTLMGHCRGVGHGGLAGGPRRGRRWVPLASRLEPVLQAPEDLTRGAFIDVHRAAVLSGLPKAARQYSLKNSTSNSK